MRLNSSWTCSVLYFKRLIQLLDVIGRLKSLPCEKYLISMHWPFTGPDRRLLWIKLTSLESCPAYRLPIRQINFYSYFWCFRNLQRLYKTFSCVFVERESPKIYWNWSSNCLHVEFYNLERYTRVRDQTPWGSEVFSVLW